MEALINIQIEIFSQLPYARTGKDYERLTSLLLSPSNPLSRRKKMDDLLGRMEQLRTLGRWCTLKLRQLLEGSGCSAIRVAARRATAIMVCWGFTPKFVGKILLSTT